MRTEFVVLLAVQVALRALGLILLCRRGLARAYWPLALFLGIGIVRQGILLYFSGNQAAYRQVWTQAQWLNGPMDAVLAWSAVHAVAKHYKNTYPFAVGLGAVAALLGVLISWWLRNTGATSWPGATASIVIWQRSEAQILLAVVLLGLAWFSARTVPLSPNAERHGLIAAFYFAIAVVRTWLQAASAGDPGWIRGATWVEGLGAVAYYTAWAFFLTQAGQAVPPAGPPTPDVDLKEHVRAMRARAGL